MIDSGLKDKLLDGLQDAIDNYNSGLDEETAIAKSASDHNFNKAQTERLVELYNTSRTLHHFDSNKTEKAASFHLADKEEVLGLLFDSSNEKLALEFATPSEAATEYDEPETDFYECKSAEEFPFDATFTPSEHDIPDIDANSIRIRKQVSKLQKEAEYLQDESNIENELARKSLSKLANHLSMYYSSGSFEKLAAAIGVLAQPENIPVLQMLEQYLPAYVLEHNVKIAHVVDDRIVRADASLISDIAEHVGKADKLAADSESKLVVCKQAMEAFDKLVDDYVKEGRQVNEMESFISKNAGFASGLVLGNLLTGASNASKEMSETSKSVKKEIDDANQRLVNTHREMLLTELINNDPYLSEEDPSTIATYYNNFAQLSPELANNKEVVRSVLRQAVHNGGGGYSPFDASSFLNAEKALGEIRGTLPPSKSIQIKMLASPDVNG